MESRAAMHAQPIYQALMPPDEAKFIDLTAMRMHMLDTPVVQIGAPTTIDGQGVRLI
jgi:hypothetical protein